MSKEQLRRLKKKDFRRINTKKKTEKKTKKKTNLPNVGRGGISDAV